MDVLIVANFCLDFSDADNGRFKYIADRLCKNNDVEVVTSSFFHTTKKHRIKEITADLPYRLTFISESGYKKNICLKRFYSHYMWGRNVAKYVKARKRPDVIYCAVPSLTAGYLLSKYCEQKNIKFVIDIQDLWPEAFQMIFNVPVISDIIFSPFKYMADSIYKRANHIVAVSSTYTERALRVNKKAANCSVVYLGTSLKAFDENAASHQIPQKEVTIMSNNKVEEAIPTCKPKNEFWIGYCGTLGASYDIKTVIDALSILNNENTRFIVVGDGPDYDRMLNYARQKGIKASFTGRVPYNEMCGIIRSCDININPIKRNAAASIINKHADYAAAGKPVINTQTSKEYCDLIDRYKMGINCESENAMEIAHAIKDLASDGTLRKIMGKNARLCAEKHFDRTQSYLEIKNAIHDNK